MSAIDANANALSVFMDKVRIGTLHNEEPLSFSYEHAWLADPAAKPLDATAATLVFCWLYPAPPANATVAGTVAPGDFAPVLEDL